MAEKASELFVQYASLILRSTRRMGDFSSDMNLDGICTFNIGNEGLNCVRLMKQYINFSLGCVQSFAMSIERYGDEMLAAVYSLHSTVSLPCLYGVFDGSTIVYTHYLVRYGFCF